MYSNFFFKDTATTEIYTLSLHDALPISREIEREQRVSLAHHVARMQDLSQKAEDAGQYGSAIQAEHYAGKVSRLYVDQAHVISEKRESPEVIIERLNKLIET